jgi:hypothetical protein
MVIADRRVYGWALSPREKGVAVLARIKGRALSALASPP